VAKGVHVGTLDKLCCLLTILANFTAKSNCEAKLVGIEIEEGLID
jgi:hypothetical protein